LIFLNYLSCWYFVVNISYSSIRDIKTDSIFIFIIINFCNYIFWFQISNREKTFIYYVDRVVKVFNQLTAAQSQYSFIICFLERKHKITVIRELFFYNNFKRSYRDNFVNFRLDFATIESDFFLLLLNSNSILSICQLIYLPICYYKNVLSISWSSSWKYSTIDIFYCCLIFLFCNVICFFAEDFDRLSQIVYLLQL